MSTTAATSAVPDPRLTVVEASAGTGKTYRITELVVDAVTSGDVPIERILVVTFTRAATAELRDRIRRRLVDAAGGDTAEAELARRAITSFDQATITTIHGFCHQALGILGLLDDSSGPSRTLRTDDGDLRREVVNDAVLQEVASPDSRSTLIDVFAPDGKDPIAREQNVQEVVGLMLTHITADVRTMAGAPTSKGATPADATVLAAWTQLVTDARDRVLRRRRELGIVTFDDVVRLARDAVQADPAAAAVLRDRYDLVLVDEFQDTDTLQWQLFSAAFLPTDGPGSRTVVVGDPKQAIYAFRGADVHAYLRARRHAGHTGELGESWRMEPKLIDAVNLLFRNSGFGEPSIVHHSLTPPTVPGHVPDVLVGDPLEAPFTVRLVPPTHDGNRPPVSAYVKAELGRVLVAADVAALVRQILAAHPKVTGPKGVREVRPSNIAVLVNQHSEAELVARALAALGIRSVRRGSDSVAASPAAAHWRWLLDAMDRPASPAAARLAALSWFVGWTPGELAEATDARLLGVQERLAEWRRILADGGVAALLATVAETYSLTSRLLARPDGERALTDLEHVAELLHSAAPGGTTPAALIDALDALEPDTEEAAEHAARRIDSDDDAVQVLTIHTSKGLEFDITLVPFTWGSRSARGRLLHDGDDLVIDATIGPRDKGVEAQVAEEIYGGEQRLLYVALTRARHRTVVWWGNQFNAVSRPVTDLLFSRTVDGSEVDRTLPGPKGDLAEAERRLRWLSNASDGAIAFQRIVTASDVPRWVEPGEGELSVNTLSRPLDRAWRRLSFSSISAPARLAPHYAEHVEDLLPADDEIVPPERSTALAELAVRGTTFGVAFHSLMERLDFAAADPAAEIRAAIDAVWPRGVLDVDTVVLVDAVDAVLRSPTGAVLHDTPLGAISRADRLDELTFELPMATSGRPHRARDIGSLMLDHLPDDDPYRGYAALLHDAAFGLELGGHLTGSIDLVARVRAADGDVRFVVCDYKTNRLAAPAGADLLQAYHPDRLPAEMTHHHYPLQALLYGAALHRYLRWRLPGYEPQRHLSGAAYLFVRGMVGAGTPLAHGRPFGVAGWAVPPSLTVALSDLLDGRRG